MSKFAAIGLAVDKSSRMTIIDPFKRQPIRDKDGNEAYIDLLSKDSRVAKKHEAAAVQRRLNMRGRMKLTQQELEAERLDLIAALTTGWYLLDFDGNQMNVPFSEQSARELYADPGMAWLYEQADEHASDRGNYSKSSSASSSNMPNTSSASGAGSTTAQQ